MEDLRKVPVIRLLVPYGLGVLLEHFLPGIPNSLLFGVLGVCLSLLIHFFIGKQVAVLTRIVFTCTLFLGLLLLAYGYSSLFSKQKELSRKNIGEYASGHQKDSKFFEVKEQVGKNKYVVGLLDSALKQQILGLAYFKKAHPQLGEIITTKAKIKELLVPRNPGQVNFQEIYERQGIYYQLFVQHFTSVQYGQERGWSFQSIHVELLKVLEQYLHGDELAVASALVLGDKQHLSTELKENYANTGAMHVLAVSGLHVGLIYLLFNFLTSRLASTYRSKQLVCVLGIVIIILFAGITGFSSSVTRSACMFSLMSIGTLLNRQKIIYNIIFCSALLMLLWDPDYLFSISFQLSYSAVLGIVFLFPKLNDLFTIRNSLLRYFWGLICLSVVATISTLPISLYNFGQLPSWFILTNLIVVPAAVAELFGGLLLLSGHFLGIGEWVAMPYHFLLQCVNQVVGEIKTWPPGAVSISLHFHEAFLLYAFLGSGILYLITPTSLKLNLFFILISIFIGLDFLDKQGIYDQKKLILLDDQQRSILVIEGNQAQVFTDSTNNRYRSFCQFVLHPALAHFRVTIYHMKQQILVNQGLRFCGSHFLFPLIGKDHLDLTHGQYQAVLWKGLREDSRQSWIEAAKNNIDIQVIQQGDGMMELNFSP